jgi:hypothetical protein
MPPPLSGAKKFQTTMPVCCGLMSIRPYGSLFESRIWILVEGQAGVRGFCALYPGILQFEIGQFKITEIDVRLAGECVHVDIEYQTDVRALIQDRRIVASVAT